MATRKAKKALSGAQARDKGLPLAISHVIGTLRRCHHLTQERMGSILGISAQNVCDVEKHRVNVSPQRAATWADKLDYPKQLLVEAALQEMINQAKLPFVVRLSLTKKKAGARKTKKRA